MAVWTYPEASLYRMFTCAFFHAGLMHIAMNMMSFHPSGSGIPAHRLFLLHVLRFLVQLYSSALDSAAIQKPCRYYFAAAIVGPNTIMLLLLWELIVTIRTRGRYRADDREPAVHPSHTRAHLRACRTIRRPLLGRRPMALPVKTKPPSDSQQI